MVGGDVLNSLSWPTQVAGEIVTDNTLHLKVDGDVVTAPTLPTKVAGEIVTDKTVCYQPRSPGSQAAVIAALAVIHHALHCTCTTAQALYGNISLY